MFVCNYVLVFTPVCCLLNFCCVLRRVGGAPWGGDTTRRRRDVTANAVLAVLGTSDWSRGARLGVVACFVGRGLSWCGKGLDS